MRTVAVPTRTPAPGTAAVPPVAQARRWTTDDGSAISIDALAEQVWYLEQPTELPAACDMSLGATFTDPATRTAFARRTLTSRIRSYRLRDVAVDTGLMLLSSGREPIEETRYQANEGDVEFALSLPIWPEPDPEPDRLHILGCNRVHYNYYHWIAQCAPAIDWGIRNHPDRAALMLLTLNPWQEETLVLLGHDEFPRRTLQKDRRHSFARLEFSEFLTASHVSLAAAATYGRMRQAVPPSGGRGEAIYVARTDVARRVAVNEAELIGTLRDEGVRIVVPGALSLREQIATFRAAKLVIGPHGAGMANIVFCEPGSFVYELLPTHYPNPCINRLAQTARLHYWADLFPTLAGHGTEHARTWHIDVQAVMARLNALRGRMARMNTPDQPAGMAPANA